MGRTVSPVNMTTAGASLGGVARVNRGHANSSLFSLVLHEGSQLSEAPGVQATRLLPLALFDLLANIGQVLQDNRSSGSGGLNNLFTENVVLISPSPKLFARESLQVSARRSGVFDLELALEPEGFGLQLLPARFSQEAVVGGNGGTGNPQVHPDNIGRRGNLGGGNIDHHMQPEFPLAGDEVGGAGLETCILESVLGDLKGNDQPTGYRGEIDFSRAPIDPEGMQVVADRAVKALGLTHLPAFTFQSKSRADGLRSFHPGLNRQIRRQIRVSFSKIVVSRFVQTYPVALSGLPAHCANVIEAAGKLLHCLHERAGLFWSWFQEKANRSIHAVYYCIYGKFLQPLN